MEVNKVVMNTPNGEETLIDLTSDSVTPETLAEGVTAHDASGEEIVGLLPIIYKDSMSLGMHTDGLLYLFVNGEPVGNGVALPSGASGDVVGNVDSGNNIVITGNLPDGTYTVKYEMEDGTIIDIGDMVLDTDVYYSVTNSLTNCTSNNSATEAVEGDSYSATITAKNGYELKSVTVTMGGNAVSVSGGVINIASVTGNIVITAVAEVAGPAYTNLLPQAVDANGNAFVGTNGEDGYKYGYRISRSSGNESATENCYCSGFIPVTRTDSIRIKNIAKTADDSHSNIVYYDSSKKYIGGVTLFGSNSTVDSDNAGITTEPSRSQSSTAIAFFRFSAGSITDKTIVTVNQEIV